MQTLITRLAALLALAVFGVGCGGPDLANTPPQNSTIVCFGDSLVEGVGAGNMETESYPAVLAELTGRPVENWGRRGDTTGDGVQKLNQFDEAKPGIIIVTLGGNDILRSVDWNETKSNLEIIFPKLKETGAVVVFTGITGPLNPGRDGAYEDLCDEHGVLYISEILDGIRNRDNLMSDMIHPNSAGYRKMAERVKAELDDAGLLTPAE